MKNLKYELKDGYTNDFAGFNKFRNELLNLTHNTFNRKLELCKAGFSEDSVHDLRVWARRFMSALDIIMVVDPNENLNSARKLVRTILKMFGGLRDTQVTILKVQELRRKHPELNYFYYELLAKELAAIDSLQKKVAKLTPSETDNFLFFYKIDSQKNQVAEIKFDALIEAVSHKYDQLIEELEIADKNDPIAIHEVRLYFKYFRYMVESLEIAVKFDEGKLHEMQNFQRMLGEIQDTEVMWNVLNSYLSIKKNRAEADFTRILSIIESNKLELIEKFNIKSEIVHELWY